jgi:hypothetical protein
MLFAAVYESASGTFRTFQRRWRMSAYGLRADMAPKRAGASFKKTALIRRGFVQ